MNGAPFKSWTDRLLEMAVALVAVGLLLNWARTRIGESLPLVHVRVANDTSKTVNFSARQ